MDDAFRRFAAENPDAIVVTDADARILFVNPACERLTGYAAAELLGRTPAILKSGTHEADFYRGMWREMRAGREFRAVFANRRKDGALYYEDKIIRPFDGGGFVSFGRDVTERSRELEKLAHAATHDSLTGLPNRSLFLDRLEQALRGAARRREPLAVAILDLDRFRSANNRYGHLGGDAVLRAVAERTQACVRDADTVARIGGDEFALILVGAGEDGAREALEKVVRANGAAVAFDGQVIPCSVSIGACVYPQDGETAFELQKEADRRMYQAKGFGGGRYRL